MKKSKRVLAVSPAKSLPRKAEQPRRSWSQQEDVALVEFFALHYDLLDSDDGTWPATKDKDYWTKAASCIVQCCLDVNCRSGML